ncbi:hypothetical protein FOBRF1_012099 [Fusarium oxysporum]
MWLSLAIHHAQSANAHNYSAVKPSATGTVDPQDETDRRSLKRLWWCCIIRDRVISLNTRRNIRISRDTFDFDYHLPLSWSDIAQEASSSEVYDFNTKASLIDVLMSFLRLCVLLTDVLAITHHEQEDWEQLVEQPAMKLEQINVCKLSLRRWYDTLDFGRPHQELVQTDAHADLSVILFESLVIMYYK